MSIDNHITKIDSTVLANYILESIGKMSHLKLQKLLYFIEGYHLAYFSTNLIDDDFEAWVHGPVSRKIYNELKDKSVIYSDITYIAEQDAPTPSIMLSRLLTSDQVDLINEVLGLYGNETGFTLESITHQQTPWIKARECYNPADKCEEKIQKEEMQSYFKQFLS
jgi:uncharacterized phage-associated protein